MIDIDCLLKVAKETHCDLKIVTGWGPNNMVGNRDHMESNWEDKKEGKQEKVVEIQVQNFVQHLQFE